MDFRHFYFKLPLWIALSVGVVSAGVINPDISAIGQFHLGYTDDSTAVDPKNPTLNLDETEIVFDSYLNPFAKGVFVFSISESGLEVEEAYVDAFRLLPFGLDVKGGKYRLGFGKLNPAHPHTYPFMEPPRVMAAMLPGDDGFNETAIEVSDLLPTPGDWACVLSANLLQGASFHPDEAETRLGWLARMTNSFLMGEKGGMDVGLSVTQGTNNVAQDTKTLVVGTDIKAKLYLSPTSQLTLQGEFLEKSFDNADTLTGKVASKGRTGFYTFFDWKFLTRYNSGAIYEQYQTPGDKDKTDRAIKVFAGFGLLEESTLFRLTLEHFMPEGTQAFNTAALQVVFSMGPHKPHQF